MAIWHSVIVASSIFVSLSLLVNAQATALRPHLNFPPIPAIPKVAAPDVIPISNNGTQLPSYYQWYYFNQLIDHNNPSLGTFRQRYYFTYEYYKPGGPIIMVSQFECQTIWDVVPMKHYFPV
jgi:hypothetical protein